MVVTHDVIAYREWISPTSTNLVVRSRDSLDVLWTSPLGVTGGRTIVSDGQIYVRDGDPPVIAVFDVDGCGASVCAPTSTISVPPPEGGSAYVAYVEPLAANDGHLCLLRQWDDLQLNFGHDLVAVSTAGTVAWTVPMATLADVEVAGDKVFVVGLDPAYEPTMMAVDRATGALLWRSDATVLVSGSPIVAGGLVYALGHRAGGTDIDLAVFAADGCGAPTCPPLTILDTGPGNNCCSGTIPALGALFVRTSGPDGGLTAYVPTS